MGAEIFGVADMDSLKETVMCTGWDNYCMTWKLGPAPCPSSLCKYIPSSSKILGPPPDILFVSGFQGSCQGKEELIRISIQVCTVHQ